MAEKKDTKLTKLSEDFILHIRSGFAGLWIVTEEPAEAVNELRAACKFWGWDLHTWDAASGINGDVTSHALDDPKNAVHAMDKMKPTGKEARGHVVMTMRHAHVQQLMEKPEFVAALFNATIKGKNNNSTLVVLAPTPRMPQEIERQFAVIDHELPAKDELLRIAKEIASSKGEFPEDPNEADVILESGLGLTRTEFENAVSKSVIGDKKVLPANIWGAKVQALRKSGLMNIYSGGEKFADLGGMEALKDYAIKSLTPRVGRKSRAKGVILLGVPGAGKSAFAKALGNETGRPTVIADIGAWMGSLVGETEANTRRALKIVDRIGRCVLFVDEVEKALAGSSSTSHGDSGVKAGLFGSLLTWMNDHTSDVFLIMTSNDVSQLPPEFMRAGRFDAIWMVDLPGQVERDAIWKIHRKAFDIPPSEARPNDEGWTGAEIEACCRQSDLLGIGLREAAAYVVPVIHTAAEKIKTMRAWANGRALDALKGGRYQTGTGQEAQGSTRTSR